MPHHTGLLNSSMAGTSKIVASNNTILEDHQDKDASFKLLFVDDEVGILNALRRLFLEEDYKIITAGSADEGINIMTRETVNLIISDYRMPGMDGSQFLREVKRKWPETIRIMLTGYADVQSVLGAINDGAVYKFITKPWNDEDLKLTVSLALQQFALIEENKQLKEITNKQKLKIKDYSALFHEDRGLMGNILVNSGVIKKKDLDKAVKETRSGEFLDETLLRLELTTESKIIKALQSHLKIDYIDLKEAKLNPGVVKFLPRELCEKSRFIPVQLDKRDITIAMADPSDIFKCDNITLMTGLKVIPLIACSSDILDQLDHVFGPRTTDIQTQDDIDIVGEIESLDEIDIVIEDDEKQITVQELMGSSDVPPIIRIVNAIISEAIRYKASDIHIEPKSKYTIVRYRIDGMLHGKIKIPADLHLATVSRIKILGKMDISERRKPQDGRISVKTGTRFVDIRVNTMPTVNDEKVVMRILDKSASVKNLDELGMDLDELKCIYTLIKRPQGIIISTGPTGSGKTTMLYSILGSMLESTKNFETIEDPVEYFLEEVTQVHVREKVGLTFASVLRATLRQDPDVVMVGEIRDLETADVAFKAALTGHMVLSTLHTNNAIASITRLIDLGIKPYLIASAMEGIIAQRLVRKICRHCKSEDTPNVELIDALNVPKGLLGDKVSRGRGCNRCDQSGYLGRTGVYEIFMMNDDFRHLISSTYKEPELIKLARLSGMKTLLEHGLWKVKQGDTTLDELLRVMGPQTSHERKCDNCRKIIDANFLYCPYCAAFKEDFCKKCMTHFEEDWLACPTCGEARAGKALPISKELKLRKRSCN